MPHILFILEEGRGYRLFFKAYEEGQLYAARVREVYDGNYFSSDPYIYENKHKPYIRPFLSEYLMGALGRISGLSINNLFIAGDFIFPVIIFYFLFYFLNLLVRCPPLSLVGSMAILLAEAPDSLTGLAKLGFPDWFLTFGRTISPQVHYIFFISCLIFVYRALADGKKIHILLSGLFLGLLFYVYAHFWAYIFAGMIILSLYFLARREFKQARAVLFIFIAALVISIPFWINWLNLMHLPFYEEVITRVTLHRSGHIVISKLSILTLFIFGAFYRKRDFRFFFIFSFLLAGLLCMNQQVLTGRTFDPQIWHIYANRQMAVIAGIVLLERFLEKNKFREVFIRKFLIAGLAFIISTGAIIQVCNYQKAKYAQARQQSLYGAFAWLENNTEKEDVVLAGDAVSLLIPIHTHNNIYWSGYIFDYANSDSDILERFFLLARIRGMSESEVIDYILTHRQKGHSDFFGVRYEGQGRRKSGRTANVKLPQDLYDYIIRRYRAFKGEDIKTQLLRFRADYLFYSPYEASISRAGFKIEPFLEKVYPAPPRRDGIKPWCGVYESEGIQIYKIMPERI